MNHSMISPECRRNKHIVTAASRLERRERF
jgi:hypothetical protein